MTPHQRRISQIQAISERHGVSLEDLYSRRRLPAIVSARREIARHLSRMEHLRPTEIGRILKVDHSSVYNLLYKDGWTVEAREEHRVKKRLERAKMEAMIQ